MAATVVTLTGLNKLVYAGNALQQFILWSQSDSVDEYGYDPLELAKRGYMLRNTGLELLYIYVASRDLNKFGFIIPDDGLNHFFNGHIAASFFIDKQGNRIPMNQAVTTPLNTFQVIKQIRPDFDPERLTLFDLEDIVRVNTYSVNDLPKNDGVAEALQRSDIAAITLKENDYVRNKAKEWRDFIDARQTNEPETYNGLLDKFIAELYRLGYELEDVEIPNPEYLQDRYGKLRVTSKVTGQPIFL